VRISPLLWSRRSFKISATVARLLAPLCSGVFTGKHPSFLNIPEKYIIVVFGTSEEQYFTSMSFQTDFPVRYVASMQQWINVNSHCSSCLLLGITKL
jgi:hypothetical protein